MLTTDPIFLKTVEDMKLGKEALDNASACTIAILPTILEDDQRKMNLIANMKQGLRVLSEKNPTLEINGINDETSKQAGNTK